MNRNNLDFSGVFDVVLPELMRSKTPLDGQKGEAACGHDPKS